MSTSQYVPAILNLELLGQGKTRDSYRLPTKHDGRALRLIYATDRLSTHNVVHKSEVPFKGQVLTALTVFWLKQILEPAGIKHHLVASGQDIYDYLPESRDEYPNDLHLRAIVVRELEMVPKIEWIWRAYLAGSLYDKYHSKGIPNPYGITIPAGMKLMEEFPVPMFTPTDKSETDEPLNADDVMFKYPHGLQMSSAIYSLGRQHLKKCGLDAVDTKLELGVNRADGTLCVADEVLTPDSSRFVEARLIRAGTMPPWLDKEIARIEAVKTWGNGPKVPLTFRPETITQLTNTYQSLVERITGLSLEQFQATDMN